jgi:FLVCR family feline leukemia virus subgroup C receptor-related protein
MGGGIGAFFWNVYLTKTHKYKKTLVVNGAIAIVGLIGFVGLLYTDSIWLLSISTFVIGFSLCSFFPLSLEYGCELIFPIGEGSAAGFLLASIHFFGLMQVKNLQYV